MALAEFIKHKDSFSKTVILVDSSSAIQEITENRSKETPILSKIRSNIRTLYNLNKKIVFPFKRQFIPFHAGIEGNEKVDALAKLGTKLP